MNLIYSPLSTIPNATQQLVDLHKLVFGPGRFTRSAYRLRENVPFDAALSTALMDGKNLIGAVIMTPILIGTHKVLLLGPLAVLPAHENNGYGTQLMKTSIEAAQKAGEKLVILVGDAPYYSRIGFVRVPEGHITLPGPVDTSRLLALELHAGILEQVRGKTSVYS